MHRCSVAHTVPMVNRSERARGAKRLPLCTGISIQIAQSAFGVSRYPRRFFSTATRRDATAAWCMPALMAGCLGCRSCFEKFTPVHGKALESLLYPSKRRIKNPHGWVMYRRTCRVKDARRTTFDGSFERLELESRLDTQVGPLCDGFARQGGYCTRISCSKTTLSENSPKTRAF